MKEGRPVLPSNAKSQAAYERLRAALEAGRYGVGDRLEPVRGLAQRMGISPFAVRTALATLEHEGYIERRHGSGNYVVDLQPAASLGAAVVVCMEMRGHLFAELSGRLVQRLQAARLSAITMDCGGATFDDALRRAARADTAALIIQANNKLPVDLLAQPPVSDKPTLLLFAENVPGLDRDFASVLIDHDLGAQLAAEQLWTQGHRSVLVVGSVNALSPESRGFRHARQGPSFIEHWRGAGGRVRTLPGHASPMRYGHVAFDVDALVETLRGPDAPTAVFALRDVDAFDLQTALARRDDVAPTDVAWFGYGDTPWRIFAPAPLPSINWRLDRVAEHVHDAVLHPHRLPQGESHYVEPEVVYSLHSQFPPADAEADRRVDSTAP